MKAGGLLAGGRRAVPFVFNPLGILVVTRKEELVPMKNFLFWDFIYFYTERILERISGGSWTLGNFSWREGDQRGSWCSEPQREVETGDL